jgi:hypothetical protein
MQDLFENIDRTIRLNLQAMIRKVLFSVSLLILAGSICSCGGPKPYYKTREGKKKQKYYNEIQFGGKSSAEMKPVKTKKKR